ncbi:carboxypeptidase [Pseudoalteromonas xiamenensis]|uniref:S10 family peptidase n=1 Tax=Pseudoalteromonas xiamenensis TaxID=882626 RepID=UPI0027E43643|nr:carboxypeptidase [Pseudoalteromonas xiamenensis]WMN60994.1 carboxypeptidase [Pseudoalteromonas xiamenensis]
MKKIVLCIALALGTTVVSSAFANEKSSSHNIAIDVDSNVVTQHKASINGEKFSYTAETGTQPVWDEEGKAIATLQYTYYQRQKAQDSANRPLVISFNGGPGSASVWMHIAYTGPKVLKIDDEGYPVQPYGLIENTHSILDVADIVYVNPVNTGYSRVLPDENGKLPSKESQKAQFFGVNADIKYLASWLNTFINRHNRALSPKFLIGESYGTTRVSGLAHELQNEQWMFLNGVILVSPTEIGIERKGPVEAANRLPYYAATAWYHKALSNELQNKDLQSLLAEVETYTLDTYLPALARGGFLNVDEKQKVAKQVALYSGLSEQFVLQNNLDIPTGTFWKELLRDRGFTIGRLDSRYLGLDKRDAGAGPDYWPELMSWLHSFTPAINYYLREELNYKTDVKYNMLADVSPWDKSNNRTGEQLRIAMAQNPYLHVMIQSGYFDGATNYFDAKYTMWQLDPSGKMSARLSFKGYESGHMMYLRRPDLAQSNQDLREFILNALPNGQAAKY